MLWFGGYLLRFHLASDWPRNKERKNINRCLGGLRIEDQGERRPQTFLVNNFSFRQLLRKQLETISALSSSKFLNTDRGFKIKAAA